MYTFVKLKDACYWRSGIETKGDGITKELKNEGSSRWWYYNVLAV